MEMVGTRHDEPVHLRDGELACVVGTGVNVSLTEEELPVPTATSLAIAAGGRVDSERVLDRYELLYSAGLVPEAVRDGRPAPVGVLPGTAGGTPMRFDHRRILATAISRLRGKLKYRPVVFELMAPEFSLTELQQTVEAISGHHVHKQNFRRLVEAAALVEPTGGESRPKRGRPAALFRFRRDVLNERPAPGLRVRSR